MKLGFGNMKTDSKLVNKKSCHWGMLALRLVPAAFIFLFAVPAHGQPASLTLVAEGGLTTAWLRNADLSPQFEHGSRQGYAYGVALAFRVNHFVSVVTGFGMERKGSSFEFRLENQPLEKLHGKSNFDYLVIPLMVRFKSRQRLAFFADAGGYYGRLLEQLNFTDPQSNYVGTETDLTSAYSKKDYGLVAGAGLGYALNEWVGLLFTTRLSVGLADTRDGAIRTSSIAFLAGLEFSPWTSIPSDGDE